MKENDMLPLLNMTNNDVKTFSNANTKVIHYFKYTKNNSPLPLYSFKYNCKQSGRSIYYRAAKKLNGIEVTELNWCST